MEAQPHSNHAAGTRNVAGRLHQGPSLRPAPPERDRRHCVWRGPRRGPATRSPPCCPAGAHFGPQGRAQAGLPVPSVHGTGAPPGRAATPSDTAYLQVRGPTRRTGLASTACTSGAAAAGLGALTPRGVRSAGAAPRTWGDASLTGDPPTPPARGWGARTPQPPSPQAEAPPPPRPMLPPVHPGTRAPADRMRRRGGHARM